jgi:hypothetical protein
MKYAASNNSFIAACVCCSHYLATAVVYKAMPQKEAGNEERSKFLCMYMNIKGPNIAARSDDNPQK